MKIQTDGHYPKQEGFSSCHLGAMHACGHDGHASIGLTTAKILMELKEHLHGTLKIIFQPAEEGVRGAKSICESGFWMMSIIFLQRILCLVLKITIFILE